MNKHLRGRLRCRNLFAVHFATPLLSLALAGVPQTCPAQTAYYRHTFFDNGPNTTQYFYSSGKAVAPSTLETVGDKLPLDREIFFTPGNSLRIAWGSQSGGAWLASIKVMEFRDREILFEGDTLSF